MKKRTIIALIVAALLIVSGIVLLVLGLSFAGTGTPESTLTQQEVLIQEPFENVMIDTEDCDVEFIPFQGAADAHIVLRERETTKHSVWIVDGTLKIEMTDEREWTDYIGTNWENMEMKIYLPEKQYESLRVYTDTGDIKVPWEFSAKEVVLRADTGDIHCFGKVSDMLDCITATGSISIRGGAPVMMKLESNTGDINLQGVTGREIHLQNDTGETELENVTAKTLSCHSSTGDVELEGVLAEDYLQVFTSTGDVGIENCDAGTVNIETDTGDVHGNFLTPKWFQAYSDSGKVNVPLGGEGGECRIETDTGDIHFQ